MAKTGPKGYSSNPRERMRQLQAEGKLTPEHGRLGGRPRKCREPEPRTANEHVARAAREDAPAILKVFQDAVKAGQADRTRLAAVKQWLDVEGREAQRELLEAEREATHEALASMPREELVAHLAA